MYTSKLVQYFILIVLIITMPVYSNSLFNRGVEAFAAGAAKQIVVNIANARTSTKITIGVGLAALIITYALIRHIIYKRDAAFFEKKGIEVESIKGSDNELRKAVKINDTFLVYKLLRYGALLDLQRSAVFSLNCYDVLTYSHRSFQVLKVYSNILEMAIMKDHALLDILLRNAENVDKELVKSALYFAIDRSDLSESAYKSIEVILRQNKCVVPNIDGDVLSCAALKGAEVLNVLIQHNKRLGKLDQPDLNQAVFYLIERNLVGNNQEAIEILIKQGADINAKKVSKFAIREVTPLADAIMTGSLPTVQFLIEKGASLEIKPGASAYDYIEKAPDRESRKQVCALLDNHRKKIADTYKEGVNAIVNTHFPKDPASVVMEYVAPVYPLMDEHPLANEVLI